MKVNKKVSILLIALIVCGSLSACSHQTVPKGTERKQTFGVSMRQLPPEPVYNRLRWVHPPSPMAVARKFRPGEAPGINPVFHLDVKDISMEKLAQLLAEASRYQSYCSSLIADRKVTFNSLGTVEELLEEVQRETGIRIIVEHDSRLIRFLAGVHRAPEFYSDSEIDRFLQDEYRSFN